MRNTEFEVIMRIRQIRHDPQKARENFIKFNFKTLMGILEAFDRKNQLKTDVRGAPEQFLEHYEAILKTAGTDSKAGRLSHGLQPSQVSPP
jgi:transitional endoplasmic reticulum ATPase